jgi:SAM-dependent methyltransferase
MCGVSARYDGHAGWYDLTFSSYAHESAGLLAELVGPADPADPVCLDIGCGTGLHIGALQAMGYHVIGLDLSADQLRVAAVRNRQLVRADASQLPFPAASIARVTMTYTHTDIDIDNFPAAVAEAARVLKPGGRLVYLGMHPAYVGAFVDRQDEATRQELRFTAGYGDERLHQDPTGRYPVRSRVGARNLTLGSFLNAFLAPPGLRLTDVSEFDTTLRRWQPIPHDGHVLPWNIAITAHACSVASNAGWPCHATPDCDSARN